MDQFRIEKVERVEKISKEDFQKYFVKPQIPVVVEKLTEDWPAYKKWNFDYIKSVAGDIEVPLYDNSPVDASKKVNEPVTKMKMGDYIDLLHQGPTELRIFLFNILKHIPQMKDDYCYPDLGLNLFKSLPMIFFGGEGSNVFMHYDIDLANILHFHFAGKKKCLIAHPSMRKYMYLVPFSNICREDIDFDNPDFEKWPALKNVTLMEADLEHGEMLYMPEGYWHYMKYITPGFSMSLRSIAKKPAHFLEAVNNVFVVRHFDNLMRKWKGNSWIAYKDKKAVERTHKRLGIV